MRTVEKSEPESSRRGALAVTAGAAALGLVVGGVTGGSVVLGTAAYDRERNDAGVSVLFAVIVGGLVGLVTAVLSSLVWILLVSRTSATPATARWVAAGAAGAVVVGVYGALTQSLDWLAGGCAIGAGLTAFLAGPRVGYRRSTKVADRTT